MLKSCLLTEHCKDLLRIGICSLRISIVIQKPTQLTAPDAVGDMWRYGVISTTIVNVRPNRQPLQALKQINWSKTIKHLIAVEHVASTQVFVAIQQCEALLALAFHYPYLSLVPTCAVDMLIHTQIEDSSEPHSNRLNLGEASLYHAPGLGTNGESDCHRWLAAFEQTQRLLKQHFGSEAIMGDSPPACCEILLLS
jgi:hypothetical protein